MNDFNDRIAALDDALNDKRITLDYEGTLQEAPPLLREMAQALSEARAENEKLRSLVGESFEAIAHDCEYHKAENTRLREGIKDIAAKFSEMEKLRSQFYTEKEQAETALLFANRERDAMQTELISLKTDMFVLNNDMDYTTGILEDVLKQRDALQARVDGALEILEENKFSDFSTIIAAKHVLYYGLSEEILTGEGES